MAEKLPIFTVDWEDWNHALHTAGENRIKEPTLFLLSLLKKYEVKAVFYMLGRAIWENYDLAEVIKAGGHVRGWHGHFHDHNDYGDEPLFRSPYWDTTPMPWPPSGGFFFRALPFKYVKWAVKRSGVFWLHPHDIDENHPRLRNPLLNLKRHIGLKGARAKLDRLLSEVQFGSPN